MDGPVSTEGAGEHSGNRSPASDLAGKLATGEEKSEPGQAKELASKEEGKGLEDVSVNDQPDANQTTAEQLGTVLEEASLPDRELVKLDVYEFRFAGVKIRVEPRKQEKWTTFLSHARPGWVAIDGRVNGRTRFTDDGLNANINHDEVIPRDILGASCEQALRASNNGRFRLIKNELRRRNELGKIYNGIDQRPDNSSETSKGPDPSKSSEEALPVEQLELVLCLSDADEDCGWSLAAIILHEKYRDNPRAMARLLKGVQYASELDSNKGSLPVDYVNAHEIEDVLTMLKVTTYVAEPYRSVRERLSEYGAQEMSRVLHEMLTRIEQYIAAESDDEQIWSDIRIPANYNRVEELYPDLKYVPEGWTFTAKEQQAGRLKLALDGVQRLVSLRGVRPGGEAGLFDVSLTEFGADANMRLPGLVIFLNRLENAYAAQLQRQNSEHKLVRLRPGVNDWGTHGLTSGGSPKESGTALPLDLLILGLNRWVKWCDSLTNGDGEATAAPGREQLRDLLDIYANGPTNGNGSSDTATAPPKIKKAIPKKMVRKKSSSNSGSGPKKSSKKRSDGDENQKNGTQREKKKR